MLLLMLTSRTSPSGNGKPVRHSEHDGEHNTTPRGPLPATTKLQALPGTPKLYKYRNSDIPSKRASKEPTTRTMASRFRVQTRGAPQSQRTHPALAQSQSKAPRDKLFLSRFR